MLSCHQLDLDRGAPCSGAWQLLEISGIYRDGRAKLSAFREQPSLQELGFSSPNLYCVKFPPKIQVQQGKKSKGNELKIPRVYGITRSQRVILAHLRGGIEVKYTRCPLFPMAGAGLCCHFSTQFPSRLSPAPQTPLHVPTLSC